MTSPIPESDAALRRALQQHAHTDPVPVWQAIAPAYRTLLGVPEEVHPDYDTAPAPLREAVEIVDSWMSDVIRFNTVVITGEDEPVTDDTETLLEAVADSLYLDGILAGAHLRSEQLMTTRDGDRLRLALARRHLPARPHLLTVDLATLLQVMVADSPQPNTLARQIHDLVHSLAEEWAALTDRPLPDPALASSGC